MVTKQQLHVLALRSERNKIAVPVSYDLVPKRARRSLESCKRDKLLVWIDRLNHTGLDGIEVDVYLLTPAGVAALEAAG